MPLLLVGLLAVSVLADGASASNPVAMKQVPAVAATRQASDDSEQPPTPEQKAASATYQNYMRSLVHSLRTSADARDRALATQMSFMIDFFDTHEPTGADRAAHGAMLRGAAEAAPDDALVQWLWASASPEDSGCNPSSPCPRRVEAVARLQPDNGSAWLPVFNTAWKANDTAAAESALAQMALAKLFDEQFGMALKAWMDVYRRYPMPKSVIARNSPEATFDDQTRNFAWSMAFAAAVATPAYQSLLKACSREKHPDDSPLRFRDCAQVGRLMLTQSTSLLSSRIGRAVLRVSGHATAVDIANARAADWQYEHWQTLVLGRTDYDVSDLKATAVDWLDTGDETQVMRRRLQRAGIPLTPPADWQPRGRNGKPISPLGESPPAK